MLKKILVIAFCYLSIESAYAQISEDSVNVLLNYELQEDSSINVYLDLIQKMSGFDPPLGHRLIKRLDPSQLASLKNKLKIKYYNHYGWNCNQRGSLDSAEVLLQKALDMAVKENLPVYTRQIYSHLGTVYQNKTDFPQSLEYYFSALSYTDSIQHPKGVMATYNMIGHLYRKMGEYESALVYLNRAQKIAKLANNKPMELNITNEIANVYYFLRDFDRVRKMDHEMVVLNREMGNKRALSFNLHNLGEDYYEIKDYEKAQDYFLESKNLKKELKNERLLISTLIGLAKTSSKLGDYQTSDAYLDSTESIVSNTSFEDKMSFYGAASDVYKNRNDYRKSLNAFKTYVQYKDSIFNEKNNNALNEIKEKYETEKKEVENQSLRDQAIINTELLQVQKRVNLILIISALIFFGIMLYALRVARQRNKAFKEVSAAKQMIETQANELRTMDTMKSQFFATISHELRTPLTLIRGNVDSVLSVKKISIDSEEKLKNAKRNTTYLSRMIDDLLELSKLELNKTKLMLVSENLVTYLERIVAAFQSMAESNEIRLKYSRPEPQMDFIMAEIDLRQFEKVINNLIYNAFKFTQRGSSIELKLNYDSRNAIIEIADQGIGIKESELPFIFDRFYQSSSNTSEHGGSGLGLAIAKELVLEHQGEISVLSEWGVGTVFKIILPAIAEAPEELTNEPLHKPISEDFIQKRLAGLTVKKPHILLVEDNVEMQNFIQGILASYFNVDVVNNGLEALRWLKSHSKPDLIISDLMMPQMDGLELLKEVKKDVSLAVVPFIVLTARTSQEDRFLGLRLGLDDYLAKPFDKEELVIRCINLIQNLNQRITFNQEVDVSSTENDSKDHSYTITKEEETFLYALENFVKENISNTKIKINDVAHELALSERQLYRKLSSITGMTPSQFINEVKLQHARKLLVAGRIGKISQLSSEVGFSSVYYFSKLYQERFGKRPSDYFDQS